MKKIVLILALLVITAVSVCQNSFLHISGTVINEKKLPLHNVSISVAGLSVSTQTDKKGKWLLLIPRIYRGKIIFSKRGYLIHEQTFNNPPLSMKVTLIAKAPSS